MVAAAKQAKHQTISAVAFRGDVTSDPFYVWVAEDYNGSTEIQGRGYLETLSIIGEIRHRAAVVSFPT